jgi:hypothetical protein
MLYLNLHRDDYVMIGDVRVRYLRNNGGKRIIVEVTSPDGTKITREIGKPVVSYGGKNEVLSATGDNDRPAIDGRPLPAIAR